METFPECYLILTYLGIEEIPLRKFGYIILILLGHSTLSDRKNLCVSFPAYSEKPLTLCKKGSRYPYRPVRSGGLEVSAKELAVCSGSDKLSPVISVAGSKNSIPCMGYDYGYG
jgi:hypothetical protein